MDYGYPQFTEAPILQEFIKTDSYRMEVCWLLLTVSAPAATDAAEAARLSGDSVWGWQLIRCG